MLVDDRGRFRLRVGYDHTWQDYGVCTWEEVIASVSTYGYRGAALMKTNVCGCLQGHQDKCPRQTKRMIMRECKVDTCCWS